MDGIHHFGEWCGCPRGTPAFTRAEALRALEAALQRQRGRFHSIRRGGRDVS
jgi:hypothetical protein